MNETSCVNSPGGQIVPHARRCSSVVEPLAVDDCARPSPARSPSRLRTALLQFCQSDEASGRARPRQPIDVPLRRTSRRISRSRPCRQVSRARSPVRDCGRHQAFRGKPASDLLGRSQQTSSAGRWALHLNSRGALISPYSPYSPSRVCMALETTWKTRPTRVISL